MSLVRDMLIYYIKSPAAWLGVVIGVVVPIIALR